MHEGQRICRIRESLGLQQKYVAAESGVSPSTINRIEKGRVTLTYRMAIRLARLFNCDLGAFDDSLGGPLRPVVPPVIRPAPTAGAGGVRPGAGQ